MISDRSLVLFLAVGILASSCARTSTVTTAQQVPITKNSPATGVWVGKWKAVGEPGDGKLLRVTLLETEPKVWKAKFDAVCDKDYSFVFDIPGREVGDKIVFDQEVDLGAQNGGRYRWKGEVQGKKFIGEYQSSAYKGNFTLEKKDDQGASLGEYCPNPKADSKVAAEKGNEKRFLKPSAH